MNTDLNTSSFSQQISQLENQVEALLQLLDALTDENRELKAREVQLLAENAELLSKTDRVRNQIEAMLGRLNALEQMPLPIQSNSSS